MSQGVSPMSNTQGAITRTSSRLRFLTGLAKMAELRRNTRPRCVLRFVVVRIAGISAGARVFQCVVCVCDLCISQEGETDADGSNGDDDADDDAQTMYEVRAAVPRMSC